MTPKEFLESKGMNLDTTTLISVIGGFSRQPDLCLLLEQYYEEKTKEKSAATYEDKRVPFNSNTL
jgi:hypothetical protein